MKKVLVVEDSLYIAEAIRILLSPGVEVTHLNDANKALDLVKEKGFDLVILDLMLPTSSGKDALLKLKADPATKKVPVMVLTAKVDALRWEPEIGVCDKFVTKPFDNRRLVADIMGLLEKK